MELLLLVFAAFNPEANDRPDFFAERHELVTHDDPLVLQKPEIENTRNRMRGRMNDGGTICLTRCDGET
jgi:hypothetical protein